MKASTSSLHLLVLSFMEWLDLSQEAKPSLTIAPYILQLNDSLYTLADSYTGTF